MDPPRDFARYTHSPLIPAGDHFTYDVPTPENLWHDLDRLRVDGELGRELFSGNRAERTRLWRELAALIDQGRVYYEAASHVRGPSAALLYYYSFLQLAKAELLTTVPGAIVGRDPHHGLSFRPSSGSGLSTDLLQVVQPTTSVFALLYRKRTGLTLSSGERLPIKRLLGNCPETSWDAARARLIPNRNVSGAMYVVARDQKQVWSKLALDTPEVITANRETRRILEANYRQIGLDPDWRTVFALGRRVRVDNVSFFESNQPRAALTSEEFGVTNLDLLDLTTEAWSQLAGLLDFSTHADDDALLCGSLYKSRCLLMPASLARYALIFYVSSLARYAPSRFNAEGMGRDAWILDGLVGRAATPLLQNAVSGIRRLHYFGGPGMRA